MAQLVNKTIHAVVDKVVAAVKSVCYRE